MTKKSFVGGTIILMLAGLVVRILGFVYRIYLSNLIGAEGMGLFQLVAPVYILIVLTLTSGISIAVSKMVAAELARGHLINIHRITKCAFVAIMAAGALISVIMFFNIDFLANVVLKDSRTHYSLLMLIVCIPAVAAASAYKGYFYGMQDVVPTAISQIVEQLVRICLVIGMASFFLRLGLEYACALATLGMALGEIANMLVLYVIYKFKRKKFIKSISREGITKKRKIIKEMLGVSIPVSFNRFVTSALSAVEYILIPRRLVVGGMAYHASIETYGKLTGMAMPLMYFPSLVTSSLATTLVPAISEAISLKNYKMVNYRISKSIQYTFVLGFIFTALFMTFPNRIGDLVYSREKIGPMLYTLSFTCIFTYLQQTLLGILNGLGKQAVSLRNSLIGSSLRIGFVYYSVPVYGIEGYMWGLIISSALVCIMNLFTVMKVTGMALDLGNWLIRPGLAGIIMYFTGRYVYSFFTIFRMPETYTVLFTITGYVIIAIGLMVVTNAVDRKEILNLLGFKKRRNHK
ncbi:MAG: stage V sporulation protein B [Bacillota bacterium]|nr:stage V sporulation protein B [Bacillota bacterium]